MQKRSFLFQYKRIEKILKYNVDLKIDHDFY